MASIITRSLEGNCLFHNALNNNSDLDYNRSAELALQQFRTTLPDVAINDYYVRSIELIKKIQKSSNKVFIWNSIFNLYVVPIVQEITLGNNAAAYEKTLTMLSDLESGKVVI